MNKYFLFLSLLLFSISGFSGYGIAYNGVGMPDGQVEFAEDNPLISDLKRVVAERIGVFPSKLDVLYDGKKMDDTEPLEILRWAPHIMINQSRGGHTKSASNLVSE